ncbi:hypothetical protein [Paraburkholderia caribensis]|uniref:hypothetical protein n=1 Tax=Paraburkholderia caribensis TaxID=75105 RepID=UPI0034D15DD4
MNPTKPTTYYQNRARISNIGRNLTFRVHQAGRGHPLLYGLEHLDIPLLTELDDFVWQSLRTHMPPFYIVHAKRGVRVSEIDRNGRLCSVPRLRDVVTAEPNSWFRGAGKLADHYGRICRISVAFGPTTPAAGQLAYAPHLALLMDLYFKNSVHLCDGRNDEVDDGSRRIGAHVYNDFVAEFRAAMFAKKLLRRELHNWGWSSQENVANLHTYLDNLFAKHDSLTVLHLRLFHTREQAGAIPVSVEDQHRDLHALRQARTVFFDRMRRKPALFTDEPRYIWSILPSLDGRYDLHITLLFDTAALQKVLEDKRVEAEQTGAPLEDHADQVGAYWVQAATGGRGSYLRSDRDAWLYGSDWVHGEVRDDGAGRREKLKETLGHLAMRRALVRLKGEPPGEYFGMRERKTRRPRWSVRSGEKAG